MHPPSKDPSESAQPIEVAPVAKRSRGLSLRVTLGLMALIALGLGLWANQLRQMREATAMIRRHHGMYYYDFEFDEGFQFVAQPKSWAPPWLRTLLGDENLHDVSYVRIVDPTFTDDDFAMLLRCFPKVRTMGIVRTAITNKSLGLLRGHQSLCGLFLENQEITDAGIDLLDLQSLPKVSLLDLRGTQVSEQKVEELEKLLAAREARLRRENPGKRIDSHGVWMGRSPGRMDGEMTREAYETDLRAKKSK